LEIKEKISYYNKLYREGKPIISDNEYDILLEKFKEQNPLEYKEFKNTLLDSNFDNEVNLDYICGSLDKFYPEELDKLFDKLNDEIIVMPKLDGLSFIVKYVNGKLIQGITRGDGYKGKDKTMFAKIFIPNELSNRYFTGFVRGEIIIKNENMKYLDTKSSRNTAVGLINSKSISDNLKYLDFIPYQILDSKKTKLEQLKELSDLGFQNIKYFIYKKNILKDQISIIFNDFKNNSEYKTDGLVLCDIDYVNENKLIPENMFAYKENLEAVSTKVKNIRWEISKQGLLKPIIEIEPTEIDNTMITNVSGYNYEYIIKNEIGIGSEILIVKSGEVIPKITLILTQSKDNNIPELCPSCNSELKIEGKELICNNELCNDKNIKKIYDLILRLNIKNVSLKTLENWKINSYDRLIDFIPNEKYKIEMQFYNDLKEKLFTKTFDELLFIYPWNGLSNKLLEKININKTENELEIKQLKGLGDKLIERFKSQYSDFEKFLKIISESKNYNPITNKEVKEINIASEKLKDKIFVVSGKFSVSRKEIENKIISNSGKIKDIINNSIDYLIIGKNPSSKLEKAKKLNNIKIITEPEFTAMIEGENNEF
jgi:DNA ligase (NAD+)